MSKTPSSRYIYALILFSESITFFSNHYVYITDLIFNDANMAAGNEPIPKDLFSVPYITKQLCNCKFKALIIIYLRLSCCWYLWNSVIWSLPCLKRSRTIYYCLPKRSAYVVRIWTPANTKDTTKRKPSTSQITISFSITPYRYAQTNAHMCIYETPGRRKHYTAELSRTYNEIVSFSTQHSASTTVYTVGTLCMKIKRISFNVGVLSNSLVS